MALPTSPTNPPPAIPGHTLFRCIGRGSYGEVWLARSDAGQFRAIKVVHRNTFEHDRPFERELSGIRKFEPVSRTHPSQVSILQVGVNRAEGYFYYAMELADNGNPGTRTTAASDGDDGESFPGSVTLSDAGIDSYQPRTLKLELQLHTRLPVDRCIHIGLALTTALDHLHQHGLIHRDIKPPNVIFVNGVPKLADIGLVTDAGATISYVGTEGFLPPEGPGTPQADIYSLGKVLYEICTGRDRMDFPELPTFIEDRLERDQLLELNQILLKACQNDPRKRYASAGDLFTDLSLLKSGKSVRRARTMEQRMGWARIIGVSLVALAAAGAITNHLINQRQLRESKRDIDFERKLREATAQSNRERSEQLADRASANGARLRADGDSPGALLWFVRALADEPVPPNPVRLAEHERDLAETWRVCPLPEVVLSSTSALRSLSLAADGRRIVTAGTERAAQVWDLPRGAPMSEPLLHPDPVVEVRLTPDGERALTLTSAGIAQLWTELSRHPVAFPLEAAAPLSQVEVSPNGLRILGVSKDQHVLVWQTGSRQLHFDFPHEHPVRAAAFSPTGQWVVSADAAGTLHAWGLEKGGSVTNTIREVAEPSGLIFHPDSRRLAVWGGNTLRLWDRRSGDWSAFAVSHDGAIQSASFSPDGLRLMTVGDDQTVRIWDVATSRPLIPPWRHPGAIRRAEFSPDGRFVATACRDQVRVWRSSSPLSNALLMVHASEVTDLRFSPPGHHLFCAGRDGSVRGIAVGSQPFPGPGSNSLPHGPQGWLAWAQLLSGREIATNGDAVPLAPGKLRELWRKLGPDLPAVLSPIDLEEWHRRQAEGCEQEHAWFAASFHWARAAKLRPGDVSLRERQERAADRLALETVVAVRPPGLARLIPPRAAEADSRLIDLADHYNAALTENWLPMTGVTTGNNLADLPQGIQKLGGIRFDIRGIIQLSGAALENLGGHFPKQVKGIAVKQRCRRLHFLHGAGWSALTGTPIGSYRVHYTDGQTQEIKIRFGQHLREWWAPASTPPLTPGAAIAWEGGNNATRSLDMRMRLYQMIWINPLPDIEISAIDFTSTMENPAPFLVALTAE